MSEAATNETITNEAVADATTREDESANTRRALLVADGGADAEALRAKIESAGFDVALATVEDVTRRVEELELDLVFVAFGAREGETRLVTLARRLRSEPESFALPVVFLFRADERTLRSAAAHFGADDYFSQDAPVEEFRARASALLWRAEAGRRSSPAVADQRSEIDNFLFLLDSVGDDLSRGATGALALVETRGIRRESNNNRGIAGRESEGKSGDGNAEVEGEAGRNDGFQDARVRSLVAAHGFLKLNLRRVDAVAFYGPATLLVYLPGADESSAVRTLARLREEFLDSGGAGELFAGVASFPSHGAEVEGLVERAESALGRARAENSAARVVVYGVDDAQRGPSFAAARVARGDAERRRMTTAVDESRAGRIAQAGAPVGASAGGSEVVASRASSATRAKIRRLMLVVSDSVRMAQVNLLLRSEGYEVRAAFDGQHALNLLRIDRPDLLVVDYELQGMKGDEMLRRLAKQSGATQTPPALVMIPAAREDLRDEVSAAGARAVIKLPYDPVELLDAARGLAEAE
jgi:DNA-binding response OmpR family regulator